MVNKEGRKKTERRQVSEKATVSNSKNAEKCNTKENRGTDTDETDGGKNRTTHLETNRRNRQVLSPHLDRETEPTKCQSTCLLWKEEELISELIWKFHFQTLSPMKIINITISTDYKNDQHEGLLLCGICLYSV